jgi:competence protein ComEA
VKADQERQFYTSGVGAKNPSPFTESNRPIHFLGGSMKKKKLILGLCSAAIFVCVLVLGGVVSIAQAQQKIVSLNKATVKDLMSIEDIRLPEKLCKAIVEYRTKNGPFKDPMQLRKVPGMTNAYFEKLNPVLKDGDVVYDPDAEPVLSPSKC